LGALLYIDHPGNAAPIIFFIVLLGSVVLRWRAEVFGFCGFVLFLLPVLFLPHHRDYLYLYLPSVFFWIGLTGLVLRLFGAFFPKQADYVLIALALIGITWQYYMRYLPGPVRWSLNNFGSFRTDIQQLTRIQPVIAPKTTLFIYGLTEYMNPFNYGPCYSVRLVYGENQIDCVIEKSPEEIRSLFAAHAEPKLLFSYKDGRLTRESNGQ